VRTAMSLWIPVRDGHDPVGSKVVKTQMLTQDPALKSTNNMSNDERVLAGFQPHGMI
jgi:hypothetical protein